MTFSLSIFLYLYIAFLVVWFFLSLSAIYHMLKFGFKNLVTFLSTFIFIIISILILASSYYYISEIGWKTQISLFDGILSQTLEF